MMKLTIAGRFVLFTAVLLVVTVALLSLVTVSRTEETLRAAERQQLEHIYHNVLASIAFEGRAAQAMSALVATIPQVQQAFASGDHEALTQLFSPGFRTMYDDYGVRQFQFHTPPATSFLRIHKLEKRGDDLSSFRHTVVETNRTRLPIRGLEVGVAGLGVRGIVPVSSGNQHIGSVEFGMSFGQAFFDDYKAEHGVDIALQLYRDGRFDTFGSTFNDRDTLTSAQRQQAFNGEAITIRQQLAGTPVALYANAVHDYSGNPIGVLEIAVDRSFYAAEVAGTRNSMMLIGIVVLLLAILGALFMVRRITKPLQHVVMSMEEIAAGQGDLTRRLPAEGHDELALLGQAFNHFVERITLIVGPVADAANRLSGTVERFSATAAQTHQGMRHQQRETEQIAAAVNQMSATVHEVAHNTASAADAAADADERSADGRRVVSASIESIEQVAREVKQVATVISRVDSDSTRIGTVLDVIGEIAEQTNLLALNAAIEAARAGEQGRGFAVVADEVRVLAQRSHKSTEEIREIIESLQKGAKAAVDAMDQGRARTEESVKQASAAGDSLTAITNAVDTISRMNAQIATASEEQSTVADEINRNIARISEVTDRTAAQAEETSHESEQLVRISEELLHLVSQFRTGNGDLLRDLEAAKSAHLTWKVKLRGFLDGRHALTVAEAVSDHECHFGQWYFGAGGKQFGQIAAMQEVRQPHAELHQLIRRIIDLKNGNKLAEAEREFSKVEPLSQRIVGLIDQIKQQVS